MIDMGFAKVLPLLFLQAVSLELTPLVPQSDSCKRLVGSEGLEPNCKFEISTSAGPVAVTCPEPEVLRIVGEYDVIRIDCQAPYLFDFQFMGNKPTEAVVPKFYRQLRGSSERWDYHIQVIIYGLNALAVLHNSDRKQNYSRTGQFSFQGSGQFTRFTKSFYLFLEEPEISEDFIANRGTEWPKYDESNVCVNLNCLPTHYQSVVRLISPRYPAIRSAYKPSTGLRVCGLSTLEEAFTCQLQANGSVKSKTVQDVPLPYGFPRPLAESDDLQISYTSKWRDNTTIETSVECSVGSGSRLATISASNAASYELLKDFVLPAFQSRSYTVLVDQNGTSAKLKTSGTTALHAGATYCGDAGRYKLASFIVDFEPSVAVLGFDNDWASFFESSQARYSKIWPNASEELEEGSDLDFTCLFNGFLFVPLAIWDIGTADGQVHREFSPIDIIGCGGISIRRLKITKDLRNVTCNAPVWYKYSAQSARAAFTHITLKQIARPTTETSPTIDAVMSRMPGRATTTPETTPVPNIILTAVPTTTTTKTIPSTTATPQTVTIPATTAKIVVPTTTTTPHTTTITVPTNTTTTPTTQTTALPETTTTLTVLTTIETITNTVPTNTNTTELPPSTTTAVPASAKTAILTTRTTIAKTTATELPTSTTTRVRTSTTKSIPTTTTAPFITVTPSNIKPGPPQEQRIW